MRIVNTLRLKCNIHGHENIENVGNGAFWFPTHKPAEECRTIDSEWHLDASEFACTECDEEEPEGDLEFEATFKGSSFND